MREQFVKIANLERNAVYQCCKKWCWNKKKLGTTLALAPEDMQGFYGNATLGQQFSDKTWSFTSKKNLRLEHVNMKVSIPTNSEARNYLKGNLTSKSNL
jgi:hypothetical protein